MFSVFWAEAGQMENAKERERAGNRTLKADDAKQLKAMIELAAAQPGIAARPELFDSDPWLLGVRNGVVDLRTGNFRPARREDYITKQAGAEYIPLAKCPLWELSPPLKNGTTCDFRANVPTSMGPEPSLAKENRNIKCFQVRPLPFPCRSESV